MVFHVHLWPIIISSAVIWINIHGVFVGIDFPSLIDTETINELLLQVAAKFHEILIVGSLGVIISQMVRDELVFGDGVPLGLISSGMSFADLKFYFQKDFYGTLKCIFTPGNRLKKLTFAVILLTSGAIALLAGPSSASLLLPHNDPWKSASTKVFLDGSSDVWTPSDVATVMPELRNYCNSSNTVHVSICPAAGYFSLFERWSRLNYTNFRDQTRPTYAQGVAGSSFFWPVSGRGMNMPTTYALGDSRLDDLPASNTFLIQPLASLTTMLQQLGTDWYQALSKRMRGRVNEVNDRQIKAKFYSPITSVRCAAPQNLSAADMTVDFPTIHDRYFYAPSQSIQVDILNRTASGKLRIQWFQLPDQIGAASIGAIFESPWTSDNTSRVVTGCTVQSGYVTTQVMSDKWTFWTGWYPWGTDYGSRIPDFNPTATALRTNGRIAFDSEWLGLLTPTAEGTGTSIRSSPDDGQISTLEAILQAAGFSDLATSTTHQTLIEQWRAEDLLGSGPSMLLEAIICSVISDGLSRIGSHRIFNQQGPVSQWSLGSYIRLPDFDNLILSSKDSLQAPYNDPANLTTTIAKISIDGLNYQRSVANYLAMTVLLTHMLLVLFYAVWLAHKRRLSQCWDSIPELIALAQNSKPACIALQNTGGGIALARTMQRMAKIQVRPNLSEPELYDHVELVFENELMQTGASFIDAYMASQNQRTDLTKQPQLKINNECHDRFLLVSADQRHSTSRRDSMEAGQHRQEGECGQQSIVMQSRPLHAHTWPRSASTPPPQTYQTHEASGSQERLLSEELHQELRSRRTSSATTASTPERPSSGQDSNGETIPIAHVQLPPAGGTTCSAPDTAAERLRVGTNEEAELGWRLRRRYSTGIQGSHVIRVGEKYT